MNIAILVLLVSFFVILFLGGHISYAMIGSSILTFFYLHLPPLQIVSALVDRIDGFTFLAIPFFILSGDIMARGGISDRLIKLADAFVGWMRGGMSMVNILASLFFGGISGSATADTASLGAILIPMMKKKGYDGEFSTAVTMASSVEGMLIPPSHNMIIYAMAAGGLSVSALFMAGIIPGIVLAIALMIYSFYLSVKRNYPKGDKFSFSNLFKALGKSIWGLGTILIVVFGVVTGCFTATESAAIACLYAVVVSLFVYREMPLKDLVPIMKHSVKVLSTVLLFIAASVRETGPAATGSAPASAGSGTDTASRCLRSPGSGHPRPFFPPGWAHWNTGWCPAPNGPPECGSPGRPGWWGTYPWG